MSPLSPGRAPVRRVAVQTRALVLSVALLTASPALSQSTLSLDEALRQALAADPAAAGAAARLDASKAQARQADTRPNPGLGVEVENFTGSGRFSALGRTETTVSYQQTYERGGKRQARIALAQSEISLVQARAEVRRLDLAKAVQLAFVEVLAAQAQVAVAEEQLSIAQRAEREVSRRVAGARDPLFAGARADAELAQARVSLDRAEANSRNARAVLAAYWNGPAAFVTPADVFEDTRRPEGLAGPAEIADLKVLSIEQAVAAARITVEQARAVQDPTVSLGIRHLQDEGAVALVVGATLPLGRYDTNRGAIDRARAERLAVEADLGALQIEREREIARLIARRAAAAAEVRKTDAEVLPNAQRAVTLVREGFNRGGFSYLDVIAAQRALIEAKARRVEILKTFHQDGASLDRLTGAHAVLASLETRP
jgi:cobalt-zinc-cadmium efflux system outer membrane protein